MGVKKPACNEVWRRAYHNGCTAELGAGPLARLENVNVHKLLRLSLYFVLTAAHLLHEKQARDLN